MTAPRTPLHARRPGRPRTKQFGSGKVYEQLLDAATELAIERGFDSIGIREIAERAGVSSGMIAYYFGDRSGLYEAMFERAFDRLSGRLRTALESLPPGADAIETLLSIHSAAMSADPWLPQLLAREVLARDGSSRERFAQRVADGPFALMQRAIEEAIERGLLRRDLDPLLVVLSVASLAAFPYLIVPVVGDQLGIELDAAFRKRLLEHNLALISRGLRARPEELE